MAQRLFCLIVVAFVALTAGEARAAPLRLGLLKFGTVSWEVDVVRHHGLARAEGVEIEIVELASTQATKVALQGGAVDVIVSDWLWVSRQRARGADYSFVPYSTALGALVTPSASPLRGLADLAGRRLGVAGGPLDKSWLILRALARKRTGRDLDTEPVFGAPPLLNEQLKAGRIDAVLTFWPYAARLEAAGMRRLIAVADAVRALGIGAAVPLVGYVFSEALAATRGDELAGFLRAARKARALLANSDAEWDRLAPLMRAPDAATRRALRDGFRAGIPRRWGADERAAARRLYAILAGIGGARLVGEARELSPGTFWPGAVY
ncbi:MAG: ABC transporter substrate-binding protein [Alphaproteobacteria bacterium]